MNIILEKATLKQRVILESMTVPERIALFKKQPHAFRNHEAKSTARILQWKHCLGVEECESIDLRFKDLGIADTDISLILGDFSSHAYENLQHGGRFVKLYIASLQSKRTLFRKIAF